MGKVSKGVVRVILKEVGSFLLFWRIELMLMGIIFKILV